MSFFSRKSFFLFLLVVVDLSLQFYSRLVGWGTRNSGFSLGLGSDILPAYFYLLLAGLLLIFLTIKKMTGFGWWLIVAGGVANGVSRIAFGVVVDYLHWTFVFPLWFNLADISITLGVIWLILN